MERGIFSDLCQGKGLTVQFQQKECVCVVFKKINLTVKEQHCRHSQPVSYTNRQTLYKPRNSWSQTNPKLPVILPKTYATRKGPLALFSENIEEDTDTKKDIFNSMTFYWKAIKTEKPRLSMDSEMKRAFYRLTHIK